jgi:hypothetical protein
MEEGRTLKECTDGDGTARDRLVRLRALVYDMMYERTGAEAAEAWAWLVDKASAFRGMWQDPARVSMHGSHAAIVVVLSANTAINWGGGGPCLHQHRKQQRATVMAQCWSCWSRPPLARASKRGMNLTHFAIHP